MIKSDFELFDIEDVEIEYIRTKTDREIHLRLKSNSRFNLLKFYWVMRAHIDQIGLELEIYQQDHDQRH